MASFHQLALQYLAGLVLTGASATAIRCIGRSRGNIDILGNARRAFRTRDRVMDALNAPKRESKPFGVGLARSVLTSAKRRPRRGMSAERSGIGVSPGIQGLKVLLVCRKTWRRRR